MTTDSELYRGSNGHDEDEAINQLHKMINSREDGIGGSITQTNLGLLKSMFIVPEEHREEQIFILCDFLDREEALDHVAAYFEAKELGMDTKFNVAYMLAIAASNDNTSKNGKTNRIAQILEAMSHVKYTTNSLSGSKQRGDAKGTPISG